MHITKKFDRAMQWAGEKMGAEARTSHTEEFRALEAEMALRQQGMCLPDFAKLSFVFPLVYSGLGNDSDMAFTG